MSNGISELPGRGGPFAYTANVSGLVLWCARDVLGRFIGYFYTEAAALAAVDAVHAMVSLVRDIEYGDVDIVQAFFVFTHSDGRIESMSRYFVADLDSGRVTSDLFETKEELIVALDRPQASRPRS
ncbi:MAG: hypothetical protein E5V95_24770 [Mesorhizobium sp.]|uniref:hypothetical protein n=1 Tax=Mesorhizobium sp. TaxID=1871066 RepID=UPI00121F1115|nr:hypothetical protein [Mesorhizobium sp.]TIV15827.1 MAG: hypothetical protein E5V95_24770 [Mesorhizobium sp.]